MKTYFVLRGDNEHLAEGELRALLEIYDPAATIRCYAMICVSSTGIETAAKISRRAGYVKESGVLIGVYDAYSREGAREISRLVGKDAIHVSVNKRTVSVEAVREFIELSGLRQGLTGLGGKRLVFSSGLAFVGIKKHLQNSGTMLKRSANKPFKRSLAVTPHVARVLVNLSRAREGSILLDPFAGTGSILIEAWSMGIRGIGVDIDWKLVRGMMLNLEHFKTNSILLLGDSQTITYREVDHVATDLPYGRGASTHGVEVKLLYKNFMDKLAEYLSKSGYACFMAPLWLEDYVDELISAHGLRLVGRYYDYVHSTLTRVISVVKW